MNNLRLLGLTAGVGSLILSGSATADFQGISWTSTSSAYGDTYLIYVDVEAGDQLNAVYGDDVNALSIDSNGGFYQNTWGGAVSTAINAGLIDVFPSLAYDSWVTIGLSDQVGNAMLNIGIDFTEFALGGAITTDNGSWFATPADLQVYEIDGRVLIGQFTVDGDIEGTINIQGKNADLTNWQERGISFSSAVIPAPGAIALLGLAGLASRRRRS